MGARDMDGGVNRSRSTYSKERQSPGVEQSRRAPSGAWAANEKNSRLCEPRRRGTS